MPDQREPVTTIPTTICPSCGHSINIGEYPFCPHGYQTGREPSQFQPILVDRIKSPDGQWAYSYPTGPDDPPTPGYERIYLNSLPEADRFVSDRDREEREIRREQIHGEEAYWQERSKERRAQADAELYKRLGKHKSAVAEKVRALIDQRRAIKFRELANRGVGFHNEALSFDQRNHHSDPAIRKNRVSVVVNGSRGG